MAFSDFKGVDNEFFYYWYLHNGSFIGTRFAQGTKQQNLSSEIIGSLLINLPSLAEQRKIAKILAAQDKVIELKEKRLAEKQRQKKYLAKQMFSGMKCVLPLSELALITMGQSPSSETYNTSFNGVPLIQGNADISNRKTFPRMYTTSPTKICSPGDILISVRAPVGTVARSTISACIGRGICSIRPKRMSDYIYEYLLYYEDKWGRVSQGSTFESISGDDIGKLSIPQHHESDQVAKMLTFAGKEIDLLSQDIEQEKRKKKALMQLLLTGIVRVNV
jgi:type I restriction enzyme S subunit